MLKNYGLTLILLLGLSAGAQASRITGDSDYGSPPGSQSPLPCSSLTFSGSTYSCNVMSTNITAEAFTASTFDSSSHPADFVIFDFEVHGAVAGNSLVLTVGAPIPPDPSPSTNHYSYGIFAPPQGAPPGSCTNGGTAAQCTHDTPPANYCDNATCINGNLVTFPLFGTNPVFFVVVQDTQICDDTCTSPSVQVSASIEAQTVPEPWSLPMVGVAVVAAILLQRRRFA
jgi:hypothetical protein